jgi:hypothetical protein
MRRREAGRAGPLQLFSIAAGFSPALQCSAVQCSALIPHRLHHFLPLLPRPSLMTFLFRTLFKKLVKDCKNYLQRELNKGQSVNVIDALDRAISTKTIESGLRYSIATGNWGEQKNTSRAAFLGSCLPLQNRA